MFGPTSFQMSTKHAILSILLILAPFVTCQSNSYLQEDQQKYLDRFDSLIADSYAEPIPAEMRAMCAKQAKLPATIPEISIPSDMNSDAAQKICSPAATCIIPAGVTVSMNSNLNVGRLIVRGTLIWTDTTQVVAAQWLCAGIVAVEDNGQFKMNVALKKAIIYVKSNSATHDILGTRVFGGVTTTASKPGFPVIDIAGRKLERTWSLLSQAAATGESAIRLMHNPGYMGWTVGDRIVIAPTTHGSTGTASNHVIKSIAGNTVTLTTPLLQSFTFATQYGYATGNAGIMSAEVINLTRSILMTGDDFEHVPCTSLLNNPSLPPAICTYGAHFSMALGGLLKLQYTRLEKCGQRGVKGKYCVHMHMMSNCPDCLVKGNAVEFGQQRGITIHGTHLSTVEDNVLNDIRGVGLYIEDGNEMYNNVLYNVVICPWALDGPKGGCSVPGTPYINLRNRSRPS